TEPRAICQPDPGLAAELADTGWVPAPDETQKVALDPRLTELATAGTLYPDHVVFLGPGVFVAPEGVSVAQALERAAATVPSRKLILFPGRGAAVPEDGPAALHPIARTLGDVLLRIPPGIDVRPLPDAEVAALLDWDAEKYRQALAGPR
ncbi:MAG: hypothetical protein WBB85_15955, partial [Albidovulum sp.]